MNAGGVFILSNLRNKGFTVTKTGAGNVGIGPVERLTDETRATVREHKAAILSALTDEAAPGAIRANEKARAILGRSKTPEAFSTEEDGGAVFLSCARVDGSGWTVTIPADQYDAFKLTGMFLNRPGGGSKEPKEDGKCFNIHTPTSFGEKGLNPLINQ